LQEVYLRNPVSEPQAIAHCPIK